MKKYIYLLLPFFLISFVLTSCKDELSYETVNPDKPDDELPVEFNFSCPVDYQSRAYIDSYGNERFSNGDVIHVIGTFKTLALQPDGNQIEGTMKRYGALRYNGINWISVENSKLTWPSIATEATFEAYYISGSTGLLTNSNPTLVSYLSDLTAYPDLTEYTDPLYGESDPETPVPYGNAAKVVFRHLCAHLTLVNLEPNVSDQYWFTVPGNALKSSKSDNTATTPFYNAFQISLKTTDGQPSLNFEFIQLPDSNYNDLIYIKGHPKMIPPPETSPLDPETMQLEFFLYPGYYDVFNLEYPVNTTETYPYLTYNYNNIPDYVGDTSNEKIPPQLEANTPYILNIIKSPGITMTTPTTEGGWDESETFYRIVDVEEFLKAAQKGTSYQEGDQKILEETLNGSRLLCNVDFHEFNYEKFEDKSFLPDLPEHNVFDGGMHYIKNIVVPVFHYNHGTIKNLGIKNPENVKMEILSYEGADKDNSRNGALCHWNRTTGTINNVRLMDILMSVQVFSDVRPGTDDSETHNIGGLVGSNTGTISEVEMGGTFTISVTGDEDNPYEGVNSTVLIGGILGQNAGEGTVSDVSTINNNLTINITNSCQGIIGDYAVGGIVGQLSGNVNGVFIPTVNIDCTQSIGVTSYIGGMAGNLTTSSSDPETGVLRSCNVGGRIQSGETKPYGKLTAGSYTGGIGGVVMNVTVMDCNSAVSVTGPTVVNEDVIYATGGAFGRIRTTSSYTFEKMICYGSSLSGPEALANIDNFVGIGNFAGIVPVDPAWETWYNSFASKQITVRDFGFELIGIGLP